MRVALYVEPPSVCATERLFEKPALDALGAEFVTKMSRQLDAVAPRESCACKHTVWSFPTRFVPVPALRTRLPIESAGFGNENTTPGDCASNADHVYVIGSPSASLLTPVAVRLLIVEAYVAAIV
jgi:hypothetical protein